MISFVLDFRVFSANWSMVFLLTFHTSTFWVALNFRVFESKTVETSLLALKDRSPLFHWFNFYHISLGGAFPLSRCIVVILSVFRWEIVVFAEHWLVERERLVRILLRPWQQMWNLLERICGFSLVFQFLVVWLPSIYLGSYLLKDPLWILSDVCPRVFSSRVWEFANFHMIRSLLQVFLSHEYGFRIDREIPLNF